MADAFQIIPYKVRSAGTDVPPEEIQTAINSLASQTQNALNTVATDPTGPAGGDLGGNYPNPTVTGSHIASGTINGASVGATTPSTGAFTTLTATTPVAVTSGGTGQNALNAHNVIIGEGSSAVAFAAPGTAGKMLISQGAAVDPAFANNPVITGGSVDGAPVGGTTPSTGAFTTLTATTPVGVASGGTGRSTLTIHGVLIGETTGAINQTTAGTTGQMLLGVTGADPAFGNNPTITGGTVDGATVGTTTASTGKFTTLQATSGLNSTAVGNTTPSTGAFTTLSATGTITPSTTNGIVGTATNDSANAGSVGEYVTATGTAVALTSGTAANVTSVSLTAGDWDVWGNVVFNPAGTTTTTLVQASVNTTTATQAASPFYGFNVNSNNFGTGNAPAVTAPQQRFSLSATTTVFLVATASFATSTETATGYIAARRRR